MHAVHWQHSLTAQAYARQLAVTAAIVLLNGCALWTLLAGAGPKARRAGPGR
jgi:hypothetical protein